MDGYGIGLSGGYGFFFIVRHSATTCGFNVGNEQWGFAVVGEFEDMSDNRSLFHFTEIKYHFIQVEFSHIDSVYWIIRSSRVSDDGCVI